MWQIPMRPDHTARLPGESAELQVTPGAHTHAGGPRHAQNKSPAILPFENSAFYSLSS